MKKINIAFFGTSDRSISILNALKTGPFNLAFCVTKEDVLVGREQVSKPTGVKVWCIENGVNYVTIDNMDALGTVKITKELKSKNVDLIIVCDFSFILSEEIFNLPGYKTVNIHFSLLPKYRGASPIQFAILKHDKKTGITYQLVTKKMDAGDIIFQSEYQLKGDETNESLNTILFEKSAQEINEVLSKYIEGTLIPYPQDETQVSYTRMDPNDKRTLIRKEDAKINLAEDSSLLYAKVRAFYPWPIAWTYLSDFETLKQDKYKDLKVKIYEAKLEAGKLVITRLQVEGKKIMTWEEFKNGYLVAAAN